VQIGGRLLIATHLGNQGTTFRSYLFHSSMEGVTLLCLLPASANSGKLLSQNHFAKPNWPVLTFPHPILISRITYWAPLKAFKSGLNVQS
jgi:hypothetical protein